MVLGFKQSIDEYSRHHTTKLIDVFQIKETLNPHLASLWRRLKVIENFSDKEKRSVLQYMEIIVEKHKPQQ